MDDPLDDPLEGFLHLLAAGGRFGLPLMAGVSVSDTLVVDADGRVRRSYHAAPEGGVALVEHEEPMADDDIYRVFDPDGSARQMWFTRAAARSPDSSPRTTENSPLSTSGASGGYTVTHNTSSEGGGRSKGGDGGEDDASDFDDAPLDILAVFITSTPQLSVDHLDYPALDALIHSIKPRGLIQRYTNPRRHHAMAQCLWTPYVLLTEMRQNVHAIADTRIPLQDRVATAQASPHTMEVPVPQATQGFVDALMREAEHALQRYRGAQWVLDKTCVYFSDCEPLTVMMATILEVRRLPDQHGLSQTALHECDMYSKDRRGGSELAGTMTGTLQQQQQQRGTSPPRQIMFGSRPLSAGTTPAGSAASRPPLPAQGGAGGGVRALPRRVGSAPGARRTPASKDTSRHLPPRPSTGGAGRRTPPRMLPSPHSIPSPASPLSPSSTHRGGGGRVFYDGSQHLPPPSGPPSTTTTPFCSPRSDAAAADDPADGGSTVGDTQGLTSSAPGTVAARSRPASAGGAMAYSVVGLADTADMVVVLPEAAYDRPDSYLLLPPRPALSTAQLAEAQVAMLVEDLQRTFQCYVHIMRCWHAASCVAVMEAAAGVSSGGTFQDFLNEQAATFEKDEPQHAATWRAVMRDSPVIRATQPPGTPMSPTLVQQQQQQQRTSTPAPATAAPGRGKADVPARQLEGEGGSADAPPHCAKDAPPSPTAVEAGGPLRGAGADVAPPAAAGAATAQTAPEGGVDAGEPTPRPQRTQLEEYREVRERLAVQDKAHAEARGVPASRQGLRDLRRLAGDDGLSDAQRKQLNLLVNSLRFYHKSNGGRGDGGSSVGTRGGGVLAVPPRAGRRHMELGLATAPPMSIGETGHIHALRRKYVGAAQAAMLQGNDSPVKLPEEDIEKMIPKPAQKHIIAKTTVEGAATPAEFVTRTAEGKRSRIFESLQQVQRAVDGEQAVATSTADFIAADEDPRAVQNDMSRAKDRLARQRGAMAKQKLRLAVPFLTAGAAPTPKKALAAKRKKRSNIHARSPSPGDLDWYRPESAPPGGRGANPTPKTRARTKRDPWYDCTVTDAMLMHNSRQYTRQYAVAKWRPNAEGATLTAARSPSPAQQGAARRHLRKGDGGGAAPVLARTWAPHPEPLYSPDSSYLVATPFAEPALLGGGPERLSLPAGSEASSTSKFDIASGTIESAKGASVAGGSELAVRGHPQPQQRTSREPPPDSELEEYDKSIRPKGKGLKERPLGRLPICDERNLHQSVSELLRASNRRNQQTLQRQRERGRQRELEGGTLGATSPRHGPGSPSMSEANRSPKALAPAPLSPMSTTLSASAHAGGQLSVWRADASGEGGGSPAKSRTGGGGRRRGREDPHLTHQHKMAKELETAQGGGQWGRNKKFYVLSLLFDQEETDEERRRWAEEQAAMEEAEREEEEAERLLAIERERIRKEDANRVHQEHDRESVRMRSHYTALYRHFAIDEVLEFVEDTLYGSYSHILGCTPEQKKDMARKVGSLAPPPHTFAIPNGRAHCAAHIHDVLCGMGVEWRDAADGEGILRTDSDATSWTEGCSIDQLLKRRYLIPYDTSLISQYISSFTRFKKGVTRFFEQQNVDDWENMQQLLRDHGSTLYEAMVGVAASMGGGDDGCDDVD